MKIDDELRNAEPCVCATKRSKCNSVLVLFNSNSSNVEGKCRGEEGKTPASTA